MNSSVSWLSSASARARSMAGLARTCATTRSVRSLSRADKILRFEFRARQHLDYHSLDNTMLDEGSGDCLRQCACEDTVDDLLGFGRRERQLRDHLESTARVDTGASAGLGEPLRSTSERCSDRGAPDDPCGREHESARGGPNPAGPHSQPDDDVASVRHARLPSRFVRARGQGVVLFGVARCCVVAGATIVLGRLGLGCSGCTGPTGRPGLGSRGCPASGLLGRLLERGEAPLKLGYAAVERVDRAQLARQVVEASVDAVAHIEDHPTRSADEPPNASPHLYLRVAR